MAATRRTVSIAVAVSDVFPCPADSDWVCCLVCGEPLDLHQPDQDEPRRLVGNCAACGHWYLLDWEPDTASGHMILLPDPADLRSALAAGDDD